MTFANFGKYEVDGQNYVTERDRPQGIRKQCRTITSPPLVSKMLEGRDFTIDDNDEKRPSCHRERQFRAQHISAAKVQLGVGCGFSTRLNRVPGEQLSASCPTR